MEIAEGVVRRPAAAEGHLEEEAAEAQWIRAHRHLLE
jgi:hypothetical protein